MTGSLATNDPINPLKTCLEMAYGAWNAVHAGSGNMLIKLETGIKLCQMKYCYISKCNKISVITLHSNDDVESIKFTAVT